MSNRIELYGLDRFPIRSGMQRRYLMALRKAGFSATVSERNYQVAAKILVLGPVRDKPPLQKVKLVVPSLIADNGHLFSQRHVEARLKTQSLNQVEYLFKLFSWYVGYESIRNGVGNVEDIGGQPFPPMAA